MRCTCLGKGDTIATYTVRFQPLDRVVHVETGTLIAEAANTAGIELGLPCGGQGRCGRCTVIVQEGDVYRPANQRLSADDLAAGYALACQATIQSDAIIYIPPQKIERKLQTDKTAQRITVPVSFNYLRDQPWRSFCSKNGSETDRASRVPAPGRRRGARWPSTPELLWRKSA